MRFISTFLSFNSISNLSAANAKMTFNDTDSISLSLKMHQFVDKMTNKITNATYNLATWESQSANELVVPHQDQVQTTL